MQFRKFLGGPAVIGFFVFSALFGVRLSLTPITSAEGAHAGNGDSDRKKMFLKNIPKEFEIPKDAVGELLLREYGSVLLARNGAIAPGKVIFRDANEVQAFQSSVPIASEKFGDTQIELQRAAMAALMGAMADARDGGLSITPRGIDSGRRSYEQTESLWNSRVTPGMKHWVAEGSISAAEAKRIEALEPFEQVPEILRLEKHGIYFAQDLSKSIIYSVAPPGTSQHLSMLAYDVAEFDDSRVRAILARHGWFQTVVSDLPHFTYLGVEEELLPKIGLKMVQNAGRTFWVPDL